MGFRIVHQNHSLVSLGEAFPENLSYDIGLSKPSSITYEMSLENAMAKLAYTEPYATDWILYRNDVPFLGGLHTEVNIDDKMSGMMQISGQSWSHYLERRIFPFDPANPTANLLNILAQDVTQVIVLILNPVFALSDSLTLATGTNANLGNVINYKIDPGDTETILSKITTLAQSSPGFDFWDTYDKKLLWLPTQGTDKSASVTLLVDKNAQVISYNNKGPGGTHLLALGDGTSSKIGAVYDNATARAKYRRLDATANPSDIASQAALTNFANSEGPRQATPQIPTTAKWVDQQTDIYSKIGLGDTIIVEQDFGYTKFSDTRRIVGFSGTVDLQGDEEVVITFDDPTLNL